MGMLDILFGISTDGVARVNLVSYQVGLKNRVYRDTNKFH